MTEDQERGTTCNSIMCSGCGMVRYFSTMGLEIMGVPVAEFPSGLLPLTLWALPMVTGISIGIHSDKNFIYFLAFNE